MTTTPTQQAVLADEQLKADYRSLYEISGCIADVNTMLIGRDELRAQSATIAQLEARLREAEALIRDHNAGCESQCEQRQQNGTASCPYAQYGRQCPDCPRDWLLDAAIAAHEKDGAHD